MSRSPPRRRYLVHVLSALPHKRDHRLAHDALVFFIARAAALRRVPDLVDEPSSIAATRLGGRRQCSKSKYFLYRSHISGMSFNGAYVD